MRYVIIAIFVLGLLGAGVFLLQIDNDSEESVQFIESPSQPQQVVVNDRDVPEPNEGIGMQVVELPEGEEVILSLEEEEKLAKEAEEQAILEAERVVREAEREERLEERNARAREEAIAEARAEAERDAEARRAEIEAERAAEREAIENRRREIQNCDLNCLQERVLQQEIEMCELAGGEPVRLGAGIDCIGLINMQVSGLTRETEFMFPVDDCVDNECRFEAPSIIQMNDGTYHMYIKRIGLQGTDDGVVLYTSVDGNEWNLKSNVLFAVFNDATFANAILTEGGFVRIYFDLKIDDDGGGTGIASALSENGIDDWVNEGLIIEPRKSFEDLSAVEASRLSGAKVMTTNTGEYRMYLTETFVVGFALDSVSKVWGLTSDDGLEWSWDEKVTLEYSEDFEGVGKTIYVDSVSEVEVVPFGNQWLMFYTANSELFVAKSDNGVNGWKKFGAVGIEVVDVAIINLGNAKTGDDQFLVYGEEKKVSEEAGARIESTIVGVNWISSFTLTIS